MTKFSVSFDDALYAEVRAAAKASGVSVSAWLAGTAAKRLRSEGLIALTEEIAMETGGPFTEEERAEAREWLGLSSTPAR